MEVAGAATATIATSKEAIPAFLYLSILRVLYSTSSNQLLPADQINILKRKQLDDGIDNTLVLVGALNPARLPERAIVATGCPAAAVPTAEKSPTAYFQ